MAKLVDVRDIKELKPGESVYRELALIKVRVTSARDRIDVFAVANAYRADPVDVSPGSITIELIGDQDKIDAFIAVLDGYEILEVARTGIAGLTRGIDQVTYL